MISFLVINFIIGNFKSSYRHSTRSFTVENPCFPTIAKMFNSLSIWEKVFSKHFLLQSGKLFLFTNIFLLHLVYCSGFLGIEPTLVLFLFMFVIYISIFEAEVS